MVYQHVSPAVTSVMIDASSSPSQDSKVPSKHGGVHYCSTCPPGPHTHHVYSPAGCHSQQGAAFMEHAHCGCQPGYVDGHFHFSHQQTPPRPVTVMAAHPPPPLLLRPVQPQHMQQHQVHVINSLSSNIRTHILFNQLRSAFYDVHVITLIDHNLQHDVMKCSKLKWKASGFTAKF